MGEIAVQIGAEIANKLGSLFSFGKSADKINYDNYRQAVWNTFASLVDSVTAYRNNKQLDRNGLQQYIDAIVKIAADFKNATDTIYRPKIDSAWLDPRFHDYYDFMNKVVNDYRNELITLPMPSFIDSIFGTGSTMAPPSTIISTSPKPPVYGNAPPVQQAGMSTNTLLILAAAAAAVLFLGHTQRSE